jgi:hypothetical protein
MSLNASQIDEPAQAAANASGDHELLRTFLEQRDAACPLCGYNLRQLQSSRCPECGRELRLTVGLAEPFLAAWIMLVVTLGAAGGLGLFFLIAIVTKGLPPGHGRWFVFYFPAMIPLAALALYQRRAILKLSQQAQWALALSVCIATVVIFVAFIIVIF